MWKSAQHPLSSVKKLMYSHETELPYRSWYLISSFETMALVTKSLYLEKLHGKTWIVYSGLAFGLTPCFKCEMPI